MNAGETALWTACGALSIGRRMNNTPAVAAAATATQPATTAYRRPRFIPAAGGVADSLLTERVGVVAVPRALVGSPSGSRATAALVRYTPERPDSRSRFRRRRSARSPAASWYRSS